MQEQIWIEFLKYIAESINKLNKHNVLSLVFVCARKYPATLFRTFWFLAGVKNKKLFATRAFCSLPGFLNTFCGPFSIVLSIPRSDAETIIFEKTLINH